MTEFMLSDSKCQKICGLMEWNLFSQFFPHTKASNNCLQPIICCVEMPGHDAGGNLSQRRDLKMKNAGVIMGA